MVKGDVGQMHGIGPFKTGRDKPSRADRSGLDLTYAINGKLFRGLIAP